MATKTKIKVDATGYCAECKREYPIDRFYTSNASFLGNGHLNYCQDCCEDILKYFLKKKGTMESAVYFTCAKLDIPFIRRVYESTIDKKNSLQSKSNKDDSEYNIFSYYIDYLWGTHTLQKKTEVWEDFTDSDTSLDEFNTVKKSEDALKADYEKFELDWGKQTLEDYQFLEYRYDIYTEGKPLTPAQDTLYRQLCQLELRQRKKNAKGDSIKDDQLGESTKEEQAMIIQLMDKLGISKFDNKKDKSDIDRLIEKQIWEHENTDPCETVDINKYKDMCDIGKNWGRQILRAVKNIVSASQEFPDITADPKDW
jgi:hypothetical protein